MLGKRRLLFVLSIHSLSTATWRKQRGILKGVCAGHNFFVGKTSRATLLLWRGHGAPSFVIEGGTGQHLFLEEMATDKLLFVGKEA
jgi:hypothetical protein